MKKSRDSTSVIRRLLVEEGRTTADTAMMAGVTRRRVYEYAEKHNLPINPPIQAGTIREKQFCRAIVALLPLDGKGVITASKFSTLVDTLAPKFRMSRAAFLSAIRRIATSPLP